jgi:hypothetical protein
MIKQIGLIKKMGNRLVSWEKGCTFVAESRKIKGKRKNF